MTDHTWDHRNRLVRGTVPTTDQGHPLHDDVFDRRLAKQVDLDGTASQPPANEFPFYGGEDFLTADAEFFGALWLAGPRSGLELGLEHASGTRLVNDGS